MSVVGRRAAIGGAVGWMALAVPRREASAQTPAARGLRVHDVTDPAFAGGAGPTRTAAANTSAIRAAAAAVDDHGGILFVPPGRYAVVPDPGSGSVLDLRNHLEVRFAPGAQWVYPGSSPSYHLIRGVGVRDVTLHGVWLTGTATPGSPGVQATGISLWAAHDVRIERCRIEAIAGSGLLLAHLGWPTNDVVVQGCRVESCAGDGIHLAGTHGVSIRGTSVADCGRGLAIGAAAPGTRRVTVTASSFARCRGATGGEGVDAGFDPGTQGVQLDGVRVVENASNGIQAGVAGLVVTATLSARNGGSGLALLGGDATVTGNRFVANRGAAIGALVARSLLAANLCGDGPGGIDVHGEGNVVEANHLLPFRMPAIPFHVDVPSDHPAALAVEWLGAAGISTSPTFGPAASLERAALASWFHAVRLLASDPTVVLFALPGAATFSDVPPTKPYFRAVEWIASRGILEGYPDGRFRPGTTVTRAALAEVWHRVAGRPAPPPGAPSFPDVPASHASSMAIRWAAATGFLPGLTDGTFRPAADATRADAAAGLHHHYWEGQPT